MLNAPIPAAAIAEIQEQTLQVLQTTGVSFGTPEALELFRRHGFQVEGSWVTITPEQLHQALAATPASFTLQGLQTSAVFGAGATNMAACAGAMEICEAGCRRPATSADFIRRLQLDALSPVINIGYSNPFYVPELAGEREAVQKTALALRYNPKPLIGICYEETAARQSLQLARDFYGWESGYYLLSVANMVSPLQYTAESLGVLNAYAAYGQPIVLSCSSIPGLTSPVTLSGTVVQNNAEILAGLVYLQLLAPGLPVAYGNSTFGVDMRSGSTSAGAFEAALLIPYTAALARAYHLPSRITGSLTDAKLTDYQAGMETAVGLFYALASQVDFIFHACGGLDCLTSFSFEKYLLDEELILRLTHASGRDPLYGLKDSLLDIAAVREGASFLDSEQTLTEFRREHYNPQLVNRERLQQWQKNGSPSLKTKADALLAQRLASYQQPILAPAQQKLLDEALRC